MSELIQQNSNRVAIRWQLLTGVSALALIANAAFPDAVKADDAGRPAVWIELGGQLNRLNAGAEPYTPDFTSMRPAIFPSPQRYEKPALYGFDEFGKISLEPEASDWTFTASIRYGRSSVSRHAHQQTHASPIGNSLIPGFYQKKYPRAARFADTTVRLEEQHAIVDFQAGKDVGLGLFGRNRSSSINLGIRFAQFIDKSNISLRSNPDWRFQHKYYQYYSYDLSIVMQPYHSNAAGLIAERSFRGVGPSLSWDASASLAGNPDSGELNFDWGVNAAILFGRQKVRTQHHETVRYNDGGNGIFSLGTMVTVYRNIPPARTRSRSVVVPNVGGFAGLSFKYDAAKVSFGYRGDFFFNAMDGGIETRKTYGRNFFGPYASISIGLGG